MKRGSERGHEATRARLLVDRPALRARRPARDLHLTTTYRSPPGAPWPIGCRLLCSSCPAVIVQYGHMSGLKPILRLVAAFAVVLFVVACEDLNAPGGQRPTPTPPPEPPACVPHPASQIVGDWDASGDHARDDEVYSFRVDGTYQHTWSSTAPAPGLDQPPVTRTKTSGGSYSYVAETCSLTWSPEIANITYFVSWNGSDQFCTKFSSRRGCIITFDRRSGEPDTAPSFVGTVVDQSYTAGEAITPLSLPAASGGNGTLSYSLAPRYPA